MMPILLPKRYTNTWAKNKALSFLQGHSVEEMDAFALEFFHQRLEKRLFPAGMAELRRLQREGYRLLLVSASPEVYMRAIGQALGFDAVLATPCGLGPDGQRYTGLVGENCKGVEKSLRIAAYLAANHLGTGLGGVPGLRGLPERCTHADPDGFPGVRQSPGQAAQRTSPGGHRPLGEKGEEKQMKKVTAVVAGAGLRGMEAVCRIRPGTPGGTGNRRRGRAQSRPPGEVCRGPSPAPGAGVHHLGGFCWPSPAWRTRR